MDKKFPILGQYKGEYVPWNVVEMHEHQCLINHGQSVETLASRGGLDYVELLCVLENRKFKNEDPAIAREKVRELVYGAEWIVPVTFEMCGFVKVRAQSPEAAFLKVRDDNDDIPLPLRKEYVDASFEPSFGNEEMIEEYTKMYNEGKLDI